MFGGGGGCREWYLFCCLFLYLFLLLSVSSGTIAQPAIFRGGWLKSLKMFLMWYKAKATRRYNSNMFSERVKSQLLMNTCFSWRLGSLFVIVFNPCFGLAFSALPIWQIISSERPKFPSSIQVKTDPEECCIGLSCCPSTVFRRVVLEMECLEVSHSALKRDNSAQLAGYKFPASKSAIALERKCNRKGSWVPKRPCSQPRHRALSSVT